MNILIVEDDVLLQNWLSMILTSLPEYEPRVFKASDGVEALNTCQHTPMDLVITDIKMPRMDGLELITELTKFYPSIRLAVLSSYDEFSYLKQALKLGALDYILKAEMTVEDISQLLKKVHADYAIEQSNQANASADFSHLVNAQTQFIRYLQEEGSLEDFLPEYHQPVRCVAMMVLALCAPSGSDIPVFLAANLCCQTLKLENLEGTALPYHGNNCILVYAPTSPVNEYREIEANKLVAVLKNTLNKYLGPHIMANVHHFAVPNSDLRPHFLQMLSTVDAQLYYQDEQPCCHQMDTTPTYKQRITLAIGARDHQLAAGLLQSFVDEAHEKHLEPVPLRASIQFFMSLFLSDIQNHLTSQQSDVYHTLIGSVADCAKAEYLRYIVGDFLAKMAQTQSETVRPMSPVIRTVLATVAQNYSQKITLDGIALQLSINRSYLSQLFKRETGETFGEHVEKIRIEKAKELLATSTMPINTIAEETGFSNQNYFTKVFKAATGTSPLRYRKFHSQ